MPLAVSRYAQWSFFTASKSGYCTHRDSAKEIPHMTDRPQVVVFDVLETLLNRDPLTARLEKVGQPAGLLGPWFMRFQRDAMALTLAGWCARLEHIHEDVFLNADVTGKNLVAIADKLLTLH